MADFCSCCGGALKLLSQAADIKSMKCTACGATEEVGPKSFAPTYQYQNETKVNTGESVFDKNIDAVLEIICTRDNTCGSGFIINKSGGYALTNTHVVTNSRYEICRDIVANVCGETVDAEVIEIGDNMGGGGNGIDLALIALRRVPYKAKQVVLSSSENIKNGSRTFVIGNSKGDGTSITSGIVSDGKRKLNNGVFIMTDAAINGGNSGGPMFNGDGDVIGVVVSKRCEAEGMAYAIPIDAAKDFVRRAGAKYGKKYL